MSLQLHVFGGGGGGFGIAVMTRISTFPKVEDDLYANSASPLWPRVEFCCILFLPDALCISCLFKVGQTSVFLPLCIKLPHVAVFFLSVELLSV